MKTKWPKRGVKMKEGPFKGQTIHMGGKDVVDKYSSRLQDMLADCFGIESVLITDLSTLSDFAPDDDDMKKLRLNYDSKAQVNDTLVAIAKRVWG